MSPHSCITSAFQAPATVQWEQQLGLSFADVVEGQPLQLTPLPSIQLASSFPLYGTSGLEHIFDSDSDDDDLQPWMQPPVNQPANQLPVQTVPVKQLPVIQPLSNDSHNMGKSNTATSAADAGAAVARLKQKQSASGQDHMRSYLAQLSDVQTTLRERAALAARLGDVPCDTKAAGVADTFSSDDDEANTDMEEDEEEYIIRPAKRRSSFNKHSPQKRSSQHNLTAVAAPQPAQLAVASSAAAVGDHMVAPGPILQAAPVFAPSPAAAADDGFEATLQYLAQLSDVQATLHQNATLAATLHGHPASTHQPGAPVSPRAAAAAVNPSSPGRKRRRSADQGSKVVAPAAASLGAAAAGNVTSYQQTPAAGSWSAAAQEPAAAVPQSSFKGVEYLPAERKWQAYMYDSCLGEVSNAPQVLPRCRVPLNGLLMSMNMPPGATYYNIIASRMWCLLSLSHADCYIADDGLVSVHLQVVFLDKYEHELDAALAHDREMIRRFGAAAAADNLNFSNNSAGSKPAASAVTAALDIKLPATQLLAGTTGAQAGSKSQRAAAPAAPGRSSAAEQRQFAAAAAWAAAHEAQATAAVPESRHKGVEYLPAEGRWQAYMLDTTVNQVRRGGIVHWLVG